MPHFSPVRNDWSHMRKKGYRGAVPLYDLDVTDEDAPKFQPVDDYQTWYENQ